MPKSILRGAFASAFAASIALAIVAIWMPSGQWPQPQLVGTAVVVFIAASVFLPVTF